MKLLKYSFLLILGAAVAIGVLRFSDFAALQGVLSGLGSIDSEYILGLDWALGLAIVTVVLPFRRRAKVHLLLLWILRGFVTLGVMLAYEYHYRILDAFSYYRLGVAGTFYSGETWANGTTNLIYLISMLEKYVPALHSYHALKVLSSWVGLMGGYFFWLSYEQIAKKENYRVLWLLCCFPSILFWTSILGKDPLIFLGLGIATYGIVRNFEKPSVGATFTTIFGLALTAFIRVWMADILLLALAVSWISLREQDGRRMLLVKLAVWCGLIFLAGVMADRFAVKSTNQIVQRIDEISHGWDMGGSGEKAPELKSFSQMAMFLPWGAFSALFRPLPGEITNIFGTLAGIENLILIAAMIFAFRRFRMEYFRDKRIRFIIYTVFIWAGIYAFVSYQNLGSAVRFKTQILPFLFLLAFIFPADGVRE